MNTFAPAAPVALTFSLTDDTGQYVFPTQLAYEVRDEADNVIQAMTGVAVPANKAPTVDVLITILQNTLVAGATRGLRLVNFAVVTARGTVIQSQSYLLQGMTGLVFGINTWTIYPGALLSSADFAPGVLSGWESVTDRVSRESALVEAFDRINRLQIILQYDDSQSIIRDVGDMAPRLQDLSPAQLLLIDYRLMAGLKKAQLVEADQVLQGDPIKAARSQGLISRTVGSSSEMWRAGVPLDLGICPDALRYIARWVQYGVKLVRR